MRAPFAILPLVVSAAALGQPVVFKDQFLASSAPGDMAIVSEQVESLASTHTLLPLARNGTQVFKRRNTCIVAIAHRDPTQSNLDTFVGIQLIKVFRTHASPGVIHVSRNAGWFSRDDGRPLPEERNSEVSAKIMADFASAHSTRNRLEALTYADGRRRVATAWHARLNPGNDADYSADEPFVRFWQVDPTSEEVFRDAHPDVLGDHPPIRIENRLMRFKLTDSRNPLLMPTFNFTCNDPSLTLAAIKVYLPFASDTEWTYLKFQ